MLWRVEVGEIKQGGKHGIYRRLLDLAINAMRERAVSAGMAVILAFTALGFAGCGEEVPAQEPTPIVATPTPEILQRFKINLPGKAFIVTGMSSPISVRIGNINFRSSPEVKLNGSNIVNIQSLSDNNAIVELSNPVVVKGGPTHLERRYDYWVVVPIQNSNG